MKIALPTELLATVRTEMATAGTAMFLVYLHSRKVSGAEALTSVAATTFLFVCKARGIFEPFLARSTLRGSHDDGLEEMVEGRK
jgi:hypothetical protein